MKKLFHYLPLIILILCGCSKEKDKDDYEPFNETCEAASLNGLVAEIDGDVSYEMVEDTALMNQYINCIMNCQNINPGDMNCIMDCLDEAGLTSSGGSFSLSVKFTNVTSTQITYTIVPGTWFFPGSSDYQPMLIAVRVVIIVPAYETVTTTIPVYCLAASKSAPDSESEYTLCDIVSSGCLAEIVDILRTKDMENLSYSETSMVQDIIWDCSEGEDEIDFDYLRSLPDLK
ncbi:MAG: hypothetical protein JW973_07780 [Bacteroidales bacterium]|nr:hypothetical protein [Bacteroidales bacterium]